MIFSVFSLHFPAQNKGHKIETLHMIFKVMRSTGEKTKKMGIAIVMVEKVIANQNVGIFFLRVVFQAS